MEFMLLFAIAFLVFLVLLTFVTEFVGFSSNKAEQRRLDTMAESIRKDIMLAHDSGSGYEARLTIPDNIDGIKIDVYVDPAVDVLYIKSLFSNRTAILALPELTGLLQIGCNRISKNSGVIQIASC